MDCVQILYNIYEYEFILIDEQYDDVLTKVAVQNPAGKFVHPESDTIASGEYSPFARTIYMNVLNEERVLEAMRPFFEFAFSESGNALVEQVGYVPINSAQQIGMLAAIDAGGISLSDFANCGIPGEFSIGGSTSVSPLAKQWAEIYMVMCPKIKIRVEGGSSSQGAARVCDTSTELSRVDVGGMSRDWKETEGTTTNGYEFKCVGSDRSAIQVQIAIEGLMVTVKRDGVAARCIEKLGGLTTDQLRWMYSSFDEDHLRQQGWDSDSVPNSDGNQNTHLWSELLDDPDCPTTDIRISGPSDSSP